MNPQDNPFRVRQIQPGSLPYLFDGREDATRLWSLADDVCAHHSGLILGPHGTGKTTLLKALQPILIERFDHVETLVLRSNSTAGQNWIATKIRIADASRRDGNGLLIVDGLQQLSRAMILRLALRTRKRSRMTVLATSHRPIFGWPVIHRTSADAANIRELVSRLVAKHPLPIKATVSQQITDEDLAKVGDVREFLFRMYDVVADSSEPRTPESI